jgi:hypothetical protein
MPRRIDAEAHLTALEPYHGDADFFTDVQLLHQLSRQYQHCVGSPLRHSSSLARLPAR